MSEPTPARTGLAGLRGRALLRVVGTRALIIAGLSGLAVTQPLLDLFGKNPEFFVAGSYSGLQIVEFALVVAILPTVIGTALTAVGTFVDRRVGTAIFVAVVVVLSGTLALVVLRALEVDATLLVLAVGVAFGVAAGALIVRTRGGQLFASYLAVANILFVAFFLFFSPTAELVASGGSVGDLGRIDAPRLRGPVVVLVLDEFAAATIMRPDGTLNAERYPGFAALASVSTWFRNASSQFNLTHRAVPAILTGTLGDPDDLPTYGDRPRNLFTLLGGAAPATRYESVTDMCPPSICEPPPQQPLRQALEDASIVYGHRVLPSDLRDGLPAIDQSWGNYGADPAGAEDDPFVEAQAASGTSQIERAYARWLQMDRDEKSPLGQAGVLREQARAIDGSPGVHFVHVALPHRPWTLSRTGARTSYSPDELTDPTEPGYAFYAQLDYQLHSMQVGAVDTMIGEIVDHLRELPDWEDTLLVVTSDHGTNLTPPDIGRMKITDANREEVYRMPLFIKAPGQVEGDVRDDSAQTIDVLPSIVDLLDVRTDWTFDGHSLFDRSAATTEPQVTEDVDGVLDIASRRGAQFPHGDDWLGLAAVGAHGDLVGTNVAELDVGGPSEYRATLGQGGLLKDLPTADGRMPFVLSGEVEPPTASSDPPPELVAAVNGTLAGVVGGYRPSGGAWTFVGYVADLYREGRNEVVLYEVERAVGEVTLHPLN